MLCAMLNIPQPPTSFNIYNKTVASAVADVSESSMMQAASIAVAENVEDNPSHQVAKKWTHFPEWHYISYLL